MAYYALGSDDAAPGIRTPGYVLAEMESVDAAIASLARDMAAQPSTPQSMKRGFADFAAEWLSFYREHTGGAFAWLSRGTTPVYRKVLEYRSRLEQWRAAFTQAGGQLTAKDRLGSKGGFNPWPYLLVGGGLWLAFRLLYKPRAPRLIVAAPYSESP